MTERGETDTRRYETEIGEASKPTIGAGNDEAKRNEERDEPTEPDG